MEILAVERRVLGLLHNRRDEPVLLAQLGRLELRRRLDMKERRLALLHIGSEFRQRNRMLVGVCVLSRNPLDRCILLLGSGRNVFVGQLIRQFVGQHELDRRRGLSRCQDHICFGCIGWQSVQSLPHTLHLRRVRKRLNLVTLSRCTGFLAFGCCCLGVLLLLLQDFVLSVLLLLLDLRGSICLLLALLDLIVYQIDSLGLRRLLAIHVHNLVVGADDRLRVEHDLGELACSFEDGFRLRLLRELRDRRREVRHHLLRDVTVIDPRRRWNLFRPRLSGFGWWWWRGSESDNLRRFQVDRSSLSRCLRYRGRLCPLLYRRAILRWCRTVTVNRCLCRTTRRFWSVTPELHSC